METPTSPAPGLALAEGELLAESGHRPDELGGGGLAALAERGHRVSLDTAQPPRPVAGDALFLEHPDEAPPLRRGQRLRAGLVHDRSQVHRHDEHRAAHPEHAHERPSLVQRVFEIGVREVAHARTRREVDGRRVAGVEADHRIGSVLDGLE